MIRTIPLRTLQKSRRRRPLWLRRSKRIVFPLLQRQLHRLSLDYPNLLERQSIQPVSMKNSKSSKSFQESPAMLKSTAQQAPVSIKKEGNKQYLTFWLNQQEYGIELLRVREIRGFTAITPIPNLPTHIKGVMNLRGSVLPVIDLRLKFSMPEKEYTKFTVIIIANAGAKSVGLIVDSVSDVLSVASDKVSPPPDFGSTIDSFFVSGLLKAADRLAILLDLDRLLAESEINAEAAIEPVTV
jgi:purine-binding chemotaxis protein CheW